MFGGLGGLGGGGDWNQTLMGLAIMGDSMTPRTASNPHDLTKTLAPLMAMNAKAGEEQALVSALVATGMPVQQALMVAKSKDAAAIMMQLRQERVGQAAHDQAKRDAGPLLGLPGMSPEAPSGPAVPSMGGRRSELGQPTDVENKFLSTVKSEGLTNPNALAAVGAYGNAESKWSPNKVLASWSDPSESGQPGTSGGTLSWRGDRFNAMRNFVAQEGGDPVVAQAKFFMQENPALIQRLNAARSPDEANALMADAWQFAGYNRQGGEYQRRLDLTRSYLPRFAETKVASADPGFAPTGDMPLPRRPLVDGQMQQGGAPTAAPQQIAPAASDVANLNAGREGMRPGPGQGADSLWQNAQATPEQFDEQLARARGGAPQAATQAPTAPPAPPLPIQRPPAPQQPTPPPGAAMGQPQGMPSIDPNSSDGGARIFAASGMGRGGPYLTPPPPMALAGAPASPAPVTAPIAPSATPASAPAGPQSTGGTQVAQGPAQTATDAAQTQVVERQAQTIVQGASQRGPESFTGRTQQTIAADYYKRGMALELLAATPNLPAADAKMYQTAAKFFLDRAGKYLDPSDQENLINAAVKNLPAAEQEPTRQKLLMAAANKSPTSVQEAEYVHGPGTPAARVAVQENTSKDPSPTIMANRELAARGLRPGMPQYDKEFPATQEKYAKATASTTVNEAPKSETAYDQKMGTQFAEMNQKLIEGAGNANRKIATIQRLQTLLADPNVYSGAGGEKVLQAKRLAKSLGIDVEGLEGSEAILSITNQFALELRNPSSGAGMPGAMSDSDRDFLKTIPPGLNRSKDGNALVADFMLRQEKRAIEVNDLRRDYVKANKRLDEGFYEKLDAWSAKNPLFTADDQKKVERSMSSGEIVPPPSASSKVFTKDQYDKLPSGTRFIDPKGQERIKP